MQNQLIRCRKPEKNDIIGVRRVFSGEECKTRTEYEYGMTKWKGSIMSRRTLAVFAAIAVTFSAFPSNVRADMDVETGEISEESVTADSTMEVETDRDAAGEKVIRVTPSDEDMVLVGTQESYKNFIVDGYTLTGDGATDVVKVARAQKKKTRRQLGYTEDWCADFVHDCAVIAGQSQAIPADGWCETQSQTIKKLGGKVINAKEARPGDLVFFDFSGNKKTYDHVEIVYDNDGQWLKTIGGNTGGGEGVVGENWYRIASPDIIEVVRPNYSSKNTGNVPTLSGESVPPDELVAGRYFDVAGYVFCRKPLTAVHVYIYDQKGRKVTGNTAYPNTTSFDLARLDEDVYFNTLAVGSYEYRITAESEGKKYDLLKKTFAVVKTASTPKPTPKPTAKPTATPKPTAAPKPERAVAMQRLYHPFTREHFYTNSTHERDVLVSRGWKYEGIGWYAPEKSNTPVYRLYSPYLNDHHYTTSTHERDVLVSRGWNNEGIGWYSDDEKSVPLYRRYCPFITSGSHHYTPSINEANHLVTVGWKDEGIAWYGVNVNFPYN
jgi:hypothetical protein